MRVVLVNLGTPHAPEEAAVRSFLNAFLSDPDVVDYPSWLWRPVLTTILRSRPKRVAKLYRLVWTELGSPLEAGTRRVANALAEASGADVSFAFRYGEPALDTALERESTPVVVPLFPQRTSSSSGTIERLVDGRAPVHRIAPDDPGYIAALAGRWSDTVSEEPPEHFVVSFHAIPWRYDWVESARYRRDCETTFRALLTRLDWPEQAATLSYQSRFGPEPWIGPRTAAVVRELPARGIHSVAVATPGFLTEGLETLEEIDIRARATFTAAGGKRFSRIPCVEDHPAFISSLTRALATGERTPALEESTYAH